MIYIVPQFRVFAVSTLRGVILSLPSPLSRLHTYGVVVLGGDGGLAFCRLVFRKDARRRKVGRWMAEGGRDNAVENAEWGRGGGQGNARRVVGW